MNRVHFAAWGLLALTTAAAAGEEGRAARAAPPAAYVEECGSCHVPYPARGLPATSWKTLMSGLDRHFGTDASLEPALAGEIDRWLQAHAGRPEASLAGTAPPRITRSRWFLHEHDELPASTWRLPAVKSPANCGACHRQAASGVFSEHDVRVPRADAPSQPQRSLTP